MKQLIKMVTVVALTGMLFACTTIKQTLPVRLASSDRIAVLGFNNNTSTPQANNRVAAITAGLLQTKGSYNVVMYPVKANCDLGLTCSSQSFDLPARLLWAKNKGIRYAMEGSVNEWRYKVGLDGEPSANITLKLMDTYTGKTLWSAVGSKVGGSRSGLGDLGQNLLSGMMSNLVVDQSRLLRDNPSAQYAREQAVPDHEVVDQANIDQINYDYQHSVDLDNAHQAAPPVTNASTGYTAPSDFDGLSYEQPQEQYQGDAEYNVFRSNPQQEQGQAVVEPAATSSSSRYNVPQYSGRQATNYQPSRAARYQASITQAAKTQAAPTTAARANTDMTSYGAYEAQGYTETPSYRAASNQAYADTPNYASNGSAQQSAYAGTATNPANTGRYSATAQTGYAPANTVAATSAYQPQASLNNHDYSVKNTQDQGFLSLQS